MATIGQVTGERQKRTTRFIDMWLAPGLNPTNLDILTKLKSAEDRQFSKSMGVTGKVFDENKEDRSRLESHLFGIRTDIWKPSKEERERVLSSMKRKRSKELKADVNKSARRLSGEDKAAFDELVAQDETMNLDAGELDKSRLVIKMFKTTGSAIRWKGTIEEMTVREMHNSLGCRRALASLAVVLPSYEYLILIQQNRRIFRIPPTYSFAYYQEATDKMWYVDMNCRWVSFGIDYIVEAQGRRIGKIDGKMLALGNDSRIHVYEPSLAQDGRFIDLLSLFAASIGYQRRIRANIKRRVKNIRNGKSTHVIEDEEIWLLKNPRRMIR